MDRIPDALRQARRATGMTQARLAAELGVSQALINQIERGKRALAERHYEKLPPLIRDAVIDAVKGDLRDRIARLNSIGKDP
jgi:transcriptional regulator with XRE-family HTH domain